MCAFLLQLAFAVLAAIAVDRFRNWRASIANDAPADTFSEAASWFNTKDFTGTEQTPGKAAKVILQSSDTDLDRNLQKRFRMMLAPAREISVWDDSDIHGGDKPEERFRLNLESADIVLLLVSCDLLASDSFMEERLPLIEAARNKGVILLWVKLGDCWVERTPLMQFQAAHDTTRGLHFLNQAEQDTAIAGICRWMCQMNDSKISSGVPGS